MELLMSFEQVQGQPHAVEALRSALKNGTVHHAYLFEGPEGVGKELGAIAFAQALLCPERPLLGCGGCSVCLRVAKHLHPDVHWLMPEEEMVSRGYLGRSDFDHTPSRDFRVDQIRKLQDRLSLRPLESSSKICIVLEAQKLNPQSQNAFLKTLEEPPNGTTIILVCSDGTRLLPTIRSRLAYVRFGPLSTSFIAAWLEKHNKKITAEQAALIAAQAEGSLARASELDADTVAEQAEVIRAFEAVSSKDPRTWIRFAEAHGGSREKADAVLQTLSSWARDVVVSGAGGTSLLHPELTELAREVAARVPPETLHQRYRLFEEARTHVVTRNAAPRLQLERVLIQLHGGLS
jgi:DNA polymerase III subunit delta'